VIITYYLIFITSSTKLVTFDWIDFTAENKNATEGNLWNNKQKMYILILLTTTI